MLFLFVSQCHFPWGWVCWGRPVQPGGVLCGDTQGSVTQAGSRTGNSGAVIAPRLIQGENCVASCAGFASVVIIAFRSKVATVPDTAFQLCALYYVLPCKPSVASLVDFYEDILPFNCHESYLQTRSEVKGLQKQHDLGLAREGAQILQSRRAMK